LAQGISALAILQAIADNERGCHHVVDPFQDRFDNVGLAMTDRAGLRHHLDFHPKFAEEVVPHLPELQFAFIDSSHLFDLTLLDFVLTDKKLATGGVLVFHDLWMPSLQSLARYILGNRGYERVELTSLKRIGLSPRARVRHCLGAMLRCCPLSEKVFRPEILRPHEFSDNLLVLRKVSSDARDWRFHRPF
jgi:hypothetical protein